MSLIQYCSERLKGSVCHSLFTSGVRGELDTLPRCTGAECSKYFGCLRESIEDLSEILRIEDLELQQFSDEEEKSSDETR